jgi:hypothetical protein
LLRIAVIKNVSLIPPISLLPVSPSYLFLFWAFLPLPWCYQPRSHIVREAHPEFTFKIMLHRLLDIPIN